MAVEMIKVGLLTRHSVLLQSRRHLLSCCLSWVVVAAVMVMVVAVFVAVKL